MWTIKTDQISKGINNVKTNILNQKLDELWIHVYEINTMLWIFCRSALTIVTVEVVLANNLGPSIPAAQYAVSVSEGVVVGQEIFTVPVSIFQ